VTPHAVAVSGKGEAVLAVGEPAQAAAANQELEVSMPLSP
jgi:hypothetical protein